MSSHEREEAQSPRYDEEQQQQQQEEEPPEEPQKEPLLPPARAARTYYFPVPSASADIPQDWLERLNLFFTLGGAAFVILGACAIVLPLIFSISVQTLTRWILVTAGIVALLHFLLIFGAPATTSFLLLGALYLGVGLWMVIVTSTHNYSPFFYIMAGWFVVHGIVKFLMACQLRSLTSWPALLISAVISIILAAVHFVFTYSVGLTFFSVLFGADLALTGFAFFLIAFMACLASRAPSTQEPLLEEASYHVTHANTP